MIKLCSPEFQLSLNLLRFFLVLHYLPLEPVYRLRVAFDIEVLQVFDCLHVLKPIKLILGDFSEVL